MANLPFNIENLLCATSPASTIDLVTPPTSPIPVITLSSDDEIVVLEEVGNFIHDKCSHIPN